LEKIGIYNIFTSKDSEQLLNIMKMYKTKEEIYDYVIYIPEYKTLDFLEDSREKLLEEWRKFK
jgi:hypothetical protein